MGTTSPPADIVTGEHLAGAHKQIELEISPGPLISEDLEHVWHRAHLIKSPHPVVVEVVTSLWTELEEALLLKLIREHEMASTESCESGESRPAPSA